MKLIGLLILGILIGLFNSWGVTFLWNWFVTPFGIPEVGTIQMYGLGIIFTVIKGYKKPENNEVDWESLFVSIFYCWLFVGIGFILQFFM